MIPPPSNGQVGYNNATQADATLLYISHTTRDTIGIDVFLAQLTTIQDVYLQDQALSTNFIRYNITGTPTILPNNYIEIPVLYTVNTPLELPNGSGTGLTDFGPNHNILVSFFTNSIEVDTRLTTAETTANNALPKTGGTMTGDITIGTNNIIGTTGLIQGYNISALNTNITSLQTKTQNQNSVAGFTVFTDLLKVPAILTRLINPDILGDLKIGTENTNYVRIGGGGDPYADVLIKDGEISTINAIYAARFKSTEFDTSTNTNISLGRSYANAFNFGRTGYNATCYSNNLIANAFVRSGGLSSQFLKADGTLDSSAYITNTVDSLNVNRLNGAVILLPMSSNNLPIGYLASSTGAYTSEWQAFDGNTATYFQSTLDRYTGSTGVYVGTNSTQITSIGTYFGDWVQIQLPLAITVVSYTIATANGATQRGPSTYYLLYSNDGLTWNVADSQTNYQWVAPYITTFTLSQAITSKYFRIACSLTGNTGITVNRNCFDINELVLNQSQTSNVQVPTLLTYKNTFTNSNELVSKSYVDSKKSYYSMNFGGTASSVSIVCFVYCGISTSTMVGVTTPSSYAYMPESGTISSLSWYVNLSNATATYTLLKNSLVIGTAFRLLTTGTSNAGTTSFIGQNLTVLAGDIIQIRYNGNGSNPSGVVIQLFVQL
jgi:hypothetical protein